MLSSFTHTLSNTLSGRGSHASLGQSVTSIGSARRPVHVAVVGLSGADKGAQGVGKSCLCARFVRPNPDEYQSDHISVLSASDFAGRVVNNEHWLYWGHHSHPNDPYYECSSSTALPGISNEPDLCAIASGPEQTSSSTSNTGSLLFGATSSSTSSSGVFSDSASPSDLHFALAEHTEFVDDANFEPLHSGRFEPYLRRICQLKLHSPDKLMYVCKQQLGLEREFEQRELPGGRFQVDAFVCCFDVSTSPGRSAEVSAEATAQLLFALIRTGKPVMLATTKHDQASTEGVLAYKRLLQRRDLRQANVIAVETSAHLNVNIDQTFLIAASLCDRRLRVRPTLSFADALRLRQQRAELVTHAYTQLLTSRALSSAASDFQQQLQQQQKKVLHQPTTTATAVSSAATTDPTQPPSWTQVRGWLRHQPEYVQFVHLFGSAAARRTFDQQRASNADCTSAVRLQVHLRKLRALFDHLLGEQFERKLLSGQFSSDNITVSSSSTGGPCSESDGSNDDLTEEDDESDGSRKDVANRSPSRPPPSSSDLVKSNSVDRADLRRMTDEQLWHVVKMRFARHAQFDQHFVVSAGRSWFELPVDSGHDDTRVPFDVLDTPEAAQMFSDYRHSQRLAGKRRAMRARFRRLLQRTRAIQAGTSLNDARPLFVGRKCYERLSEQHVLEVWDRHQSRLRAAAMLQLRELLSERTATCARLLGSTASNTSTAALLPLLISHLCDDERWKALDMLEEERNLMLTKHIHFWQRPLPENCPYFPSCMDLLASQTITLITKKFTESYASLFESDQINDLHMILIGPNALIEELADELNTINQDFEHDHCRFRLQLQLLSIDCESTLSIDDQLNQLIQALLSYSPPGFGSYAFVCVYSNSAELHRVYRLVQQTIQLEVGSQNQKPQATLLLSAGGHSQSIEPEAEQIAQQLQALHVDASNLQPHLQPYASFERASLTSSLHALIEQLQRRLDLIRWCPSISSVPSSSSTANQSKPFLRILICMCCGDLLPLEQLLNSLAPNSKWTRKSNRSVIVSISLPEKISSRKNSAQLRLQPVELLLSSFHGAQAYQDELLHGFLLLAAADRPSSYSAVQEFTQQIPNTPTQLIVHRIQMDYDRNDSLATALAAAEKQQYDQIATFAKSIGAHCTDFSLDRLPLSLNDFFAELIERKPHIERAFHSESDEDEFRLEQANQADLALRADGCVPPPLPVRSTLQTLQVEPTRSAPIKPARNVYRLRNRTESDKIPDFRCFSASPADHHRTSSSDQADTPSPLPVADRNLPVAVSDDSDIYASVFNQKSDEHLLKPSQIRQRRAIQTELHKSYQSCDSINQSNYRPVSSLLRQFSPQPKSSFTPLSQSRASSGASSTSGPPSTFTPPPLPPSRALPPIPAHRNQSTASPPVPAHAFGKPFSYGTATSCSLANLHQMRKPSVPQSAADHLLPCAESIPEPASGDSAAQIRRSFANERSHSMLDPPGFHSQRQRILKQQSTVSSSSDSYHLGVGSLKSTQPLTNKTSTETFTAKYITEQSSQDDDEKSDSSELSAQSSNPPPEPAPEDPLGVSPLSLNAWIEQRQASHDYDYVSSVDPGVECKKDTKPGKLNLSQFDNITSAVARLNLSKPTISQAQRTSNDTEIVAPDSGFSEYGHIKDITLHGPINASSNRLLHDNRSDDNLSSPEHVLADSPVLRIDRKRNIPILPQRASIIVAPLTMPHSHSNRSSIVGGRSSISECTSSTEILAQLAGTSPASDSIDCHSSSRSMSVFRNFLSRGNKNKFPRELTGFAQSDVNLIPLFIEKCVNFIERYGLDSEGLYRVSGNRSEVDLLFAKFDKDSNVDLNGLNLHVNTVCTALKDFVGKRISDLIPFARMSELYSIITQPHEKTRKQELKRYFRSLPPSNIALFCYLFDHFSKVCERSERNQMTSKNIAICWWPTLFPFQFSDLNEFERVRPHSEQVVQFLIDNRKDVFETNIV